LRSLAFSNQTLHRQALQFSCVPNHTNLLVKLGVHASQHYNSHVKQITRTYYHIGVKLEVHAYIDIHVSYRALDMPTWKEIRRNTLSKLRQEYTRAKTNRGPTNYF
jgi:hypothetical protein